MGKTLRIRILGRPRRIWEDDIKMDVREIRKWVELVKDRDPSQISARERIK
jgi:hypothetical protein